VDKRHMLFLSAYFDTEIVDKIICELHIQIISIIKICKDGND
jgi:hypothetical protein